MILDKVQLVVSSLFILPIVGVRYAILANPLLTQPSLLLLIRFRMKVGLYHGILL